MNTQTQLSRWLEKKPLILFRFNEDFSKQLRESRHGLDRFTLTRRHGATENMKLPTLCLAEIYEDGRAQCYVGVLKSKTAVSTFDSRLTFLRFRRLDLRSLKSLTSAVRERRLQSLLQKQLRNLAFSAVLSPKLSSSIIAALWKKRFNRTALKATLLHIPRFRRLSIAEWGQRDAIKLAMAAFGLSASEKPELAAVKSDSDSAFDHVEGRLLEDNVIGADASTIPGFSLIEKSWTGRAVFEKGGERLEIYTANRGPLEKMLGVDLIYIKHRAREHCDDSIQNAEGYSE